MIALPIELDADVQRSVATYFICNLKTRCPAPKLTFGAETIEGSCLQNYLSHNSIFKEQSKRPNVLRKKILNRKLPQPALATTVTCRSQSLETTKLRAVFIQNSITITAACYLSNSSCKFFNSTYHPNLIKGQPPQRHLLYPIPTPAQILFTKSFDFPFCPAPSPP